MSHTSTYWSSLPPPNPGFPGSSNSSAKQNNEDLNLALLGVLAAITTAIFSVAVVAIAGCISRGRIAKRANCGTEDMAKDTERTEMELEDRDKRDLETLRVERRF